MSDQPGTTRQIRPGLTSGISEEMNCDNRSETGGCGKYGHSLDHHRLVDGHLVCDYCGSTCPYKPYPQQVHLVSKNDRATKIVEAKTPDGRVAKLEVPIEGRYRCRFCGKESGEEHGEFCSDVLKQTEHVACHLWAKW